MAAYLIEPHRLRLDYDARLEQAIQYACDNQIHITLWPVGTIIPTGCKRLIEKFDATTFGDTATHWLVQDELEVTY